MNACSKKIKVYIFAKISSRTVLKSIPFCSILFRYAENNKKLIDKIEISKIVFLIFHERLIQRIKIYIFAKISYRTVLKYLPICSISFGYGQNQKN